MKKLKFYSIPHLLHIETTYKCNSNCIFCYNPNRNTEIDYVKLDSIVESVHKARVPHVYLIGGEPSMLSVEKLNEYIELLSEYSSVTIVTNGVRYLEGLSKKLACLGIPIHGNKNTHEYLNNNPNSYDKIIKNIKKYVSDGFDVRCIPVLMNVNYNQIYDIIKLAKELNMESVFVDRYEEGGIGSKSNVSLKPSIEQFKDALGQMIKARNDFNIPIGWGTAIPYCLDERLIKENMYANCGVGVTFCAVNPNGDLRICNQSEIVYGNVINKSIQEIWNSNKIDNFRNLDWVGEPCNKCSLLYECVCGCKVDQRCSNKYCVDYAIRDLQPYFDVDNMRLNDSDSKTYCYPEHLRRFKRNRFTKINNFHKELYIVTQYQTIEFHGDDYELINFIINKTNDEEETLCIFGKEYEARDIRELVSKLIEATAIELMR